MRNIGLLLVLACGSSTPSSTTPSEPEETEPEETEPVAVTEATPEPAPEPAAPVVLRGPDALLREDGRVEAFGLVGEVEMTGAGEYWMEQQASVEVAYLDAGERVVIVALPVAEEEDPPNRYQVLMPRDGALQEILDLSIGAYGAQELRFPGDGTAEYTEDGWSACDREEHPQTPVEREVVVMRMQDGRLEEAERRPTGETQDCSMLAACPFVYVVAAEGEALAGEILRNLRGASAYATQTLALGGVPRGVEVVLREEKPETTYLDSVSLEVDGVVHAPVGCGAEAYCEADGVPFVMREGDELRLRFAAPAGEGVLRASGYYVPR